MLCSALLTILALTNAPCPTAEESRLEIASTNAALPELAAPVSIDFDAVDIPTIHAGSLEDAVRAEGWTHARERFLQMDLARRQSAGELARIFPQAIASDRAARPLGLRAIAQRALGELEPGHRALLERYAEGVNAQLASGAPLEYRMLRQTPEPWKPEDSLLVQLGMASYLDSSADTDRARAALYARVPAQAAAFLSSSAGPLSMSIDGSPLPAPFAIPSAAILDIHTRAAVSTPAVSNPTVSNPTVSTPAIVRPPNETTPGSNAFAVAGTRTKDGRAIVGNDMHLALSAPGIWYRIALEWPGGTLVGLSLPGVPLIAQGSNGHIAWAFTNLTADLSDLVLLERDPADPNRYLVPGGSEPFIVEEVRIGAPPGDEALTIRSTRYGPIVDEQANGNPIALHWVFFEPHALDVGLFDIAAAQTLDDALKAARGWHGPPQNTLVASKDGRIGWTIAGSLPARDAATPTPVSWRDAPAWHGVLASEKKPILVDPASGVLTSANQLSIVPEGALASVLGSNEAPGDRASRLRTLITARSDWTELELHKVQLDVYSARLVRWRDALLAALPTTPALAPSLAQDPPQDSPHANDAAHAARALLVSWNGQVDTDAAAPEIIDACRREVRAAMGGAIGSGAADGIDDEALLRMLESRAPHLLPAPTGGWSAFIARVLASAATATRLPHVDTKAAAKSAAKVVAKNGASPASSADAPLVPIQFRTRGASNICAIRHPAADAFGPAAKLAEMPRAQLPGHPTCVRVQTPTFGASERSNISPAHLSDGVLVTPCGQAGMPTSPHFRDLHPFWQRGEPYPLLPGATKRRVELTSALAPPKVEPESR